MERTGVLSLLLDPQSHSCGTFVRRPCPRDLRKVNFFPFLMMRLPLLSVVVFPLMRQR